jgi:rhodanese-related sulfurtransferase
MGERGTFKRIGIPDAEEILKRPGVVILDVRDATSYQKGHIDGAKNVSSRNLGDVINSASKTAPVLVYCYKGNASQEYSKILCDFGFTDVSSLDGGFEAWSKRPAALQ